MLGGLPPGGRWRSGASPDEFGETFPKKPQFHLADNVLPDDVEVPEVPGLDGPFSEIEGIYDTVGLAQGALKIVVRNRGKAVHEFPLRK